MAYALCNYYGGGGNEASVLQVPDSTPGAGGEALVDDLKILADRIGPCKYDATVAPTADDDENDGYRVGSRWFNLTTQDEYICLDATATAAVWIPTSLAPGSVGTSDIADGAVTAAKIAKTGDGALDLAGAVCEGSGTKASGTNAHAEGSTTEATAEASHAEGVDSIAAATGSHAEGDGSFANAYGAHAEGQDSEALGVYSHAEGTESKASLANQHAQAGDMFANAGDAQHSRIVLHEAITHDDAEWHRVGSSALSVIPEDTLWTFDILLSGASQGMAKTFSYRIVGTLARAGGITNCLAMTVTTIYESDSDFDASVTEDDTGESLAVLVKDSTSGGDVVRWVADVRLCEVGFPAA